MSFAAFPVSLAIVREELAPGKLASAMGLLSAHSVFGGAVGMVLTDSSFPTARTTATPSGSRPP